VNGLNATTRVDAFWLAAHNEPQLTLHYDGLALGTNRLWLAETEVRGRTTVGYLKVIATGVEAGQIICNGWMSLAPGNNFISMLAEQTNGHLHIDGPVWQPSLRAWPMYRWQDGS
jgi:hypothetical protein